MFTPKNIQVALEELYDLCDPDYMMDMLENYGEEFDDISPTLLAQAFQKRAEMVSEYRMLSTIGEGFSYQGTALLQNRAVRLLSFSEDGTDDERVHTIQRKEDKNQKAPDRSHNDNPVTSLFAFGCSIDSPSISHRYCCGVIVLTSSLFLGH